MSSNEFQKSLIDIKYFRNILEKETDTLHTVSKKWIKDKENFELSEDVIGDIDVATGQADLLIKERFSQFQSLIDDCEFNRGEKKVTIQDLEGFWTIIYIQVQQIHFKFTKLKELKENNWVQKPVDLPITRKPLTPKNSVVIKRKPIQTKSKSNLREHILAARKLMKNEKNVKLLNGDDNLISVKKSFSSSHDYSVTPSKQIKNVNNIDFGDETKNFEAGFFRVMTPVKTPTTTLNRKETFITGTPKLLSSTVLKKQLEESPLQHKNYFPCMRITRSMKKSNINI